MGFQQSCHCDNCGIAATVGGGDDFGFYAKTQTRDCRNYEAIVDVVTYLPSEEMLDTKHRLEKRRPWSSADGTVWRNRDLCPRCNTVIEATGEEAFD